MKKFTKIIVSAALAIACALGCTAFAACGDSSKTITVCASDVPHAEVLNGIVKSELKAKGYNLKVTILDWQEQNGAVANGDYDANYFQHVPYLMSGDYADSLIATCKVHYEPLGIYYGKASAGTSVADGKSFEICNDVSNGIRAFQLLAAKGVSLANATGDLPYNTDASAFTFTGETWTTASGVSIKLVAENLLVASKGDYDFACLPCNTAYTGNVTSATRAAVEDDADQVAAKANIIAARKADYQNNETYKAKIDALTDVMLSKAVSDYFATKYLGAMTCDSSSQIDLRK